MKKWIFITGLIFYLGCEAQTGTEIILFNMKVTGDLVTLSGAANITNHKGYDNQPYFHPQKPLIYYSSFDDSSRSDIKYYDYALHQTKNLTLTHEKEYSPTVTPDGKYISCIIQRDDGSQDLGQYPIEGGKAEVLINNLKVGYHAWAGPNKLLLFVLVDSNTNKLHYYDLSKKWDTILATNPGRALHKIPGRNTMSFVQKTAGKDWSIIEFDPATFKSSEITKTIPGQDQLTWLQNGIILMSDGSVIFSHKAGSTDGWRPVEIVGDSIPLKGITRLAANKTNDRLAVVVAE